MADSSFQSSTNPVSKSTYEEHGSEARLFCKTCSVLVCPDCRRAGSHKEHEVEEVQKITTRELVSCLQSMKEEIENRLPEIANQVNNCMPIMEKLEKVIEELKELLDKKKEELFQSLEAHAEKKRKELQIKKESLESIRSNIQSMIDDIEQGLEEGQEHTSVILQAKALVNEKDTKILAEFQPDTCLGLVINKHAHRICENFGELVEQTAHAEHCYATGDGVNFAIAKRKVSLEVHAMTREQTPYTHRLNLTAHLENNTNNELTVCKIEQQKNGLYRVTYKPIMRGQHTLHIKVDGAHIRDSPYAIAVTPAWNSRAKRVRELEASNPSSITTNGSKQCVVEHSPPQITLLTPECGKIRTIGSEDGQLINPNGVAMDQNDNIYVTDDHCIKKFTSEGTVIAVVGSQGTNDLQFNSPIGICLNKTDHLLYVCDRGNHRIQVLTTDLIFVREFGKEGDEDGQFQFPSHCAFDSANNLYITDLRNNRIQVFTAEGEFLRAFSQKTDHEELALPFAIAIDSTNIVYVSEQERGCVSLFTSQGKYILSFRGNKRQFKDICGLCVDHKNNHLTISDGCASKLLVY